jgi:hypothetical protein
MPQRGPNLLTYVTGTSQLSHPAQPIKHVASFAFGQFLPLRLWVFGDPRPPERATLRQRKRRGRPRGSGYFASAEEFMDRALKAIHQLKRQGQYPSQPRVLAAMNLNSYPKRLREWLDNFGLSWDELKRRV